MLIIILLTLIAVKLHIFSPVSVILSSLDVLVGIVMLCTSTRELFRDISRMWDLSCSVRLLRPFFKKYKYNPILLTNTTLIISNPTHQHNPNHIQSYSPTQPVSFPILLTNILLIISNLTHQNNPNHFQSYSPTQP